MLGREGRAQGGDHVGHTSLMQRDRVEVPFDDHDLLLSRDALACDLKPVQRAAFPEERSFRRVQVLGHPVINHTPTEADDALLEVADRQDDPPAEAVVVARGIAGLFAALIPRDDQAGRGKILDRPSNLGLLATLGQRLQPSVPRLGGVADAELLDRLRRDPPLLQIDARRLGGPVLYARFLEATCPPPCSLPPSVPLVPPLTEPR